MAWANTTKKVDGNSDVALALGLYGYEFAQAAEIMRDFEGWSSEDGSERQRQALRPHHRKGTGHHSLHRGQAYRRTGHIPDPQTDGGPVPDTGRSRADSEPMKEVP